jgi:hypothetical protein
MNTIQKLYKYFKIGNKAGVALRAVNSPIVIEKSTPRGILNNKN